MTALPTRESGANNKNRTGNLKNQRGEDIKCWHCQQNHFCRDCPTARKHQKTCRSNRTRVNTVGDKDTEDDDDHGNDIICELMAHPTTVEGN